MSRLAETAGATVAVLVFYVALGLGFHRQSQACFDSRHALDGDQGASSDGVAAVADVVLWPVFLMFTPAGYSCEPLRVQGE